MLYSIVEPIVDTSSSSCTAELCKKSPTDILEAGCAKTCNIKNPPTPSRGKGTKYLLTFKFGSGKQTSAKVIMIENCHYNHTDRKLSLQYLINLDS